jgi:hypothetical protein
MAIDQRDVSSTLRFMDDRALQQYAAMYKNDPYIFPLAFQESQNRQRLRMSQQGAQGMQPQPKVNEQALAQMAPQQLPEQMGIGALPADNMQRMADGGIAGYDDADFVSRSEPVVMMAGGGHIPRYQGNPQDGSLVRARGPYEQPPASMTGDIPGFVAGTSIFQTQPTVDEDEPFLRRLIRERAEAVEAKRVQEARVRAMKGQPLSAEDQARIANADKAKAVADTSAQDLAQFDAASNLYMTERAAKQAAAKPAPAAGTKAAPRPDTVRRNITDPSATRKEPVQATTDAMGMFNQALEKAEQKVDPFETQIKAINAAKVKAGEENVKGLEAINKQFADIFKGRKDRLDTREGEIAKMDKQVLGLAAVLAGARMMQTRGSIGEAIGAGIDTGSKQYVAGQDKINAAKDKLSDARDRLEELEAQRGELSARELHKARNEVKALTVAGMENLVQAAMAERKMNRAEAIAFVEQQIKISEGEKDRASREGIAAIGERGANVRSAGQIEATLNTPERMAFNAALEKTKTKENPQGDPAAAYQSIISMKREPVSMEKLRGDWLDMTKRMQIQADYPNIKTFEDYVLVMNPSAGGGGGAGGDGLSIVNVRPGP